MPDHSADGARPGHGAQNRVELIFSFFPQLCYRGFARTWLGNRSCSGCLPWRGFRQTPWQAIMIDTKPTIVELDVDKLEEILRRVDAQELHTDDYETIRALIESYVCLTQAVGDKNTTIRRLRQMLFGAKTEKTAAVIGSKEDATTPSASGADNTTQPPPEAGPEVNAESGVEGDAAVPAKAKGHGRNGADAYTGAEKIEVPHESLEPGDRCPQCYKGTLYETGRPGVLVRLMGQAPVGAKVYYLQKLRCELCGVVFTAEPPAGADVKYDATAGSMIAVLKYGSGMPFNRAEKLQASLGIPLPASTQWDIVRPRRSVLNRPLTS